MNPRQTLWELYEEWKVLTRGETEAISLGHWHRLENLQKAKLRLQAQIVAAEQHMPGEPGQVTLGPAAVPLFSLVSGLIQMEKANRAALATRLAEAHQEQADLDGSLARLRKLRHSYATGRPSAWHSYS